MATGCFFSTAIGELRSYENPKNKITAVPAADEEIWGATFQVTWLSFAQFCNSKTQHKNLTYQHCQAIRLMAILCFNKKVLLPLLRNNLIKLPEIDKYFTFYSTIRWSHWNLRLCDRSTLYDSVRLSSRCNIRLHITVLTWRLVDFDLQVEGGPSVLAATE